jgi:3-oxoacyl-[acyl-carrier protein] reductase
MKLRGRNAIITGGSQGLGRAIVERFVAEGANVVFCARDEEAVKQWEAELKEKTEEGQRVIGRSCDVSNAAAVTALFGFADAHLGTLHILVNNAGIYGPKGPSEEIEAEQWCRCLEINLYGTFFPSREAARRFKKSRSGKIINLSGGGATNPLPNLSAYAASKAAVVRLSETLAEELREYNIDVNAIAPGALNTRLLNEVLSAGPEKVGADFHARAVKQAQEGGVPLSLAASLCVYLASAESDGITGKLLSAKWDPWASLHLRKRELDGSDIYTLRRIVPEDRGKNWSG